MFQYTSQYTVYETTRLWVSSYTNLLLYEAPLHRLYVWHAFIVQNNKTA